MANIQSICKALVVLVFIAGISGCDKIDPPYKKKGGGTGTGTTDTTKFIRKILIEDYTGHTCPNCPNAAAMLTKLADTIYKGRIIGMAVHCSSLAAPTGSPFTYDFRTSEGTTYDNFADFQISSNGLPYGMLNRLTYQGSKAIPHTDWASVITDPANKYMDANGQWTDPDVGIKLTNTYDVGARTITCKADVKFLNSMLGNYKLCILYTEDSIVKPQKMPAGVSPSTNLTYVHMHALRGSLTGDAWGYAIPVADPAKDYTYSKTTSAVTIKTDAVSKYCRVIAFVYNDATKEVVQVEEKSFQ